MNAIGIFWSLVMTATASVSIALSVADNDGGVWQWFLLALLIEGVVFGIQMQTYETAFKAGVMASREGRTPEWAEPRMK